MILPPLMHGAAQWAAMTAITTGQSLVFRRRLSTGSTPTTCSARSNASGSRWSPVVGDAIARPLLAGSRTATAASVVAVRGRQRRCAVDAAIKERLIDALPNAIVIDGVGSRRPARRCTTCRRPGAVSTGTFNAGPDTVRRRRGSELDRSKPGHDGIGWLAQRGYVPLGYMGDAAKTAATFPVIEGVRYAVPGDRARHLDDGRSSCSAATR